MSDKKDKTTNANGIFPTPGAGMPLNDVGNAVKDSSNSRYDAEPLPESSRPRKDGPGGN